MQLIYPGRQALGFQCAGALPFSTNFSVTPAWVNRVVLGSHGPRLQAFAREHPEVRMLAGHMWRSFFERQRVESRSQVDSSGVTGPLGARS
jgi:hypothetical protein